MQAARFSRLFDLTPAGCPIFVCAGLLAPDRQGRVRVVSGRGLSPAEARERCLAEGVERALAVWDDTRPVTNAPYSDLASKAVDPRHLVLLSRDQYAGREAWNATVPPDHRWPGPIDPGQPLDWVEARTLADGGRVLVPAAYCFLGYPGALEQGFPVPDSSGLAAGDTLANATARAVLELVERDAVAIWWYNRLKRPPLGFARDRLPWLDDFGAWLGQSGHGVSILDLTHDLGIPVAAAISSDADGRDLALGFAAGWTAESAAGAALGELVQFEVSKRLHTASGGQDLVSLSRLRSLADFEYFVPDGRAPAHPPIVWSPHAFYEALAEQGLPAYVVDLSRPGNHVVRAVVPGLRPLWPRFAPGRLFDVPYRLGWTEARTPEASLNPVPILY